MKTIIQRKRCTDMPDEDYRDQRRWHFDKTINVPTVIAICSIVIGLGSYVRIQEARLTTVEVKLDSQVQAQRVVAEDMRTAARDLQAEGRGLRIELMQYVRDMNSRGQHDGSR